MTRKEKIVKMHALVFEWFAINGRDLPWRRTADPYAILVSEVMLQQTQVDRVIPKWEAFLERFPTWRHLADASQADVIRMWHGLGYNRRAMNVHRLAKSVVERGVLPNDPDEMMDLPGIGPYTGNAVAAFAFRHPDAAPVDTNIERVFKRVFNVYDADRRKIEKLVFDARPSDTWTWNHALMDIGALHCTARHHDWATCPLAPLHGTKPKKDEDLKIPRQSKFEDSDRMYRGRIVSVLGQRDADPDELARAIQLIDEERFGKILASLITDGIVREDRGILSLA
ncbi:MAG: HhH-GPD family protein [Candidatus Uhrbacteria bacterium GW2011_GWD2_52_7]|uniref:Adenine DNA glycosylase n=1 Tax=Candidatus Uhrbacteria bacterium GW2011_GWD2_52_7 TaxID=1618989 RepID=A0A0G1ZML6_9BACT|nr:MAG: HhH-GPD family protein [Candidatus Uhrbacteria bacterium GW2011_GWD2_52_7]